MTRGVKTVSPDTSMRQLHQMLAADDFNGYPVLENGKLVGVVSKFDLLNCFALTTAHPVPHYDDLMNKTVSDVMTRDFISTRPDMKLTRVLQLMVTHRVRSVPVVDVDNRLTGIISREDVMRALDRCASGHS